MTNDQKMALIKIRNRYLTDIIWLNAAKSNLLINNNIDIWRIAVSSNLSMLDSFLAIMQTDEIERANRFFKTNDKNRFIISRGALRNILGRYLNQLPATIEFELGINKKPYIKNTNNTKLYFNISHSGDWILLAISDSEIGVDTEFVNQSFDYKEVNYINANESIGRFFMLWTRKEALIKATGKGLNEELKLIPCLDGTHLTASKVMDSPDSWLVSSFKLYEQYIATVANNIKTTKIRFLDVYF